MGVVMIDFHSIVNICKDKYGDRFKYYLTGSYARNESNFNDYDIAIYDTQNNNKDWEPLLKLFYNGNEKNVKFIDAQITQYIPEVIKMSGNELFKNRDMIVKRYIYSDKKIKDNDYAKYNNVHGKLWEKKVALVSLKHRRMGLDRIKRIYRQI